MHLADLNWMDVERYLEHDRRIILVTGATGYIGGRLVPRLLEAGHRVRCLAREPRKLDGRPWASDPRVEVVAGDTSDIASLRRALEGCGAAYYLVHSMVAAGHEYAERDRTMARAFARAAEDTGLERIVYLGGLGELGAGLSEHLASRREVEELLASGQTPVTVLRAAMIIGSGSASFEILRYLVERLPVMVTPRWVSTESQPIAVRNVVQYLVDCLGVPETSGQTLDIGGPDVLSYRELMRIMAEERGLRRRYVVPVPVLTPRLSSLWIHLVTPISHRIARPLAEGLRNRVVCRNDDARRLMPQDLLTVREAIRSALDRVARLAASAPADRDLVADAAPVPAPTSPLPSKTTSVSSAVPPLESAAPFRENVASVSGSLPRLEIPKVVDSILSPAGEMSSVPGLMTMAVAVSRTRTFLRVTTVPSRSRKPLRSGSADVPASDRPRSA